MGSTRARWASHHGGAFALAEYERSVDTPSAAPACSTRSCGCDAKGSSHRMHPDKWCGCLTKLPCASACSTNATCCTAHCPSDERCATRTRWTPSELARWLGPCKTRRLPSARGGHRCKPPWRPSWSKPPCKPSAQRARIESTWPVPRAAAQYTAARSLCLRMGGRRVIVADTEAVLKTALAVAVSSRERYVHDCPAHGASPACPCLLLPFMRCGLPRRAV